MLLAALATACTSSDNTSEGTLTKLENTGGFCDGNAPWCGYDLVVSGTTVTVTSRSAPATATGQLTAAGQAKLSDAVAQIPVDAADEVDDNCLDAPTVILHVDFDSVGARTFSYSCGPGTFAPLANAAESIAGDVMQGRSSADVTVAVP
ncbi:MAG TPA: hypothetical protein VLB44_03180 [Kofleriaceae bacterium]|nr:hypothetical protein [Kofleriaceae bacterium]